MLGISCLIYFASYLSMSSMAKPNKGSDGTIISEGCDLNIEGGIAE